MKGALGNLMQQAQQMQQRMKEMQAELAALEVTGSAGGGLVQVTLTGSGDARRVNIDPSALDDRDMLEDLIAAAINDAQRKVEAAREEKMGGLAGGLNLPPGFNLNL